MTEPPFRLARHPPGRPRGDPDFQVFADWITEDVIQRLYASRQDIAEALADAPILAFDPDLLLCGLLVNIDNLRQIASTMTADPDACPSRALRAAGRGGRRGMRGRPGPRHRGRRAAGTKRTDPGRDRTPHPRRRSPPLGHRPPSQIVGLAICVGIGRARRLDIQAPSDRRPPGPLGSTRKARSAMGDPDRAFCVSRAPPATS